MSELHEIARALVAEGKGILAADESSGTIKKRFDSIGVESTEENRRSYRDLLFTTPGAEEFISGVILYDETIRQSSADGTPFPKLLESKGIIPGIKVDLGAKPLAGSPEETVTEGLDGLRERCQEYYELGARFTKWRAVINIGKGRPSEYAIWTNAHALGRYAALSQEAGLVPIVEPEVLMDGDHTIEESFRVTERTLRAVFTELFDQRVEREGSLLKTNMVVSGYDSSDQADVDSGRRANDQLPRQHGAVRSAGRRLPVGRHVRRGRNCTSQRDEPARAAPVAALVLVWEGAPGARAQGLGRRLGQGGGRAAGLLPAREVQRRRSLGLLRTRLGAGGSSRLELVSECGSSPGCDGWMPGPDADRVHITSIWARLRTTPGAAQRGLAAQRSFWNEFLTKRQVRDLFQLLERVRRLDAAHRSAAGAHDDRVRRRAVARVADAAEERAGGDAGGGEEDVLAADKVVGGQHPVEVVAVVHEALALLVVPGPELALDRRRRRT